MRSRKLLALIFTLLAIAPALAGYMTLLGAGSSTPQPIVSYDFISSPSLPATLNLARSSSASNFNSSGTLTVVSTNTPRFDYNPATLVNKGFLVEGEPKTNLLLNSASDGSNLATQNVTVTAQSYTISFYGSGTITLSGAASASKVGTDNVTQSTLTFTPSAGTLTVTVSGTVIYANLVAGSIAPAFIPTAGSAVTRSADILTLIGAALTAAQGPAATIIMEWDSVNASFGISVPSFLVANGGYPLLRANNATTLLASSAAGNSKTLTVDSSTFTSTFRVGLSYDGTGFSLAANGTSASSAAAFTPPTTTVWVGNSNGAANLAGNNHLRSFAIYNRRLSDAILQQKTVVGTPY